MKANIEIKKELHKKCLDLAQAKIDLCNDVLLKINEAKTGETKSSAGDKYETSREMLQGEEDKTTATLSNAIILKNSLDQINPQHTSSKVEIGALVICSHSNFYIAVGLGKIELKNNNYWSISLASPLAKKMFGKQKGETFNFNGTEHTIKDIF